MKKNVAGQKIGVQMITAADGAVFTSTVTVYVTGDAGTQAIGTVGSGVCTHEGNGYHTYAPSQAETNYDLTAFTFIGTGAIATTLQAYNSFPQTVDNNVLASGATGFAAIDTVVDNILLDTAEIGTAGAGLTNIGTIATVTNLTNLPSITANWLTAAGTAADFTTEIQAGLATSTALATVDTVVDGIQTDLSNATDGLGAIKAETALILVDTGTTLEAHLTDIKGGTFSGATDSLEAIRDRGDAAWTTGAGGSSPTVIQIRQEMDSNSTQLAAIVADTNELQTDDIPGRLTTIEGATFSGTTDSLEAIRDRGDAAWTTGAGGSAPTVAQIRTEMDNNSTQLAAIVADTNELQTDDVPTLIASLDAVVDTVKAETALIVADTNELQTDNVPGLIAALNDVSTAEVNAQMVDVLNVDTFAEPGQGAPGSTITLAAKINYLYKAWRNKSTQTSSTYSLFDDAGTTVDQKATVSDDATTATKGEVATGP